MAGNYAAMRDLHTERRTFFARAGVALILCSTMVVALGLRLVDLQVTQHHYFSTRSNENRMRVVLVPPVRGLIFDRNGVVLAQNNPAYVLELIPEQVMDLADTLQRLGQLIALSEDDLQRFEQRRQRTPRFRGVPLRSRLSLAEVAAYEINRHDFPGVDVKAGLSRHYPLGESTAHAIGYVGGVTEAELANLDEREYRGTTQIGKTGIEKSHEELLHGQVGSKIVEANAAGRPLRELDYQRGAPGHNLYLTLDSRLQAAAETAMFGREGAVVALDPRNGDVLALVSKPGFDPQLFVEGIDHASYALLRDNLDRPLFNRATQGQYPPGSTIKPQMALAGLEYGLVSPSKSEFCPGHYQLPTSERLYRDWKRRGHGWMDMEQAITESCDIYFYQLALDLGIDRIHELLSKFGLGLTTGLDLPGEQAGLLPSREWKRASRRESWYPGETLNVGIGQGYMTTTPLQLAQATARIAMRGRGFVPHMVHRLQTPGQKEILPVSSVGIEPIKLRAPEFWDRIVDAMVQVTDDPHGTGYRAFSNASYTVAGKTGTAQVAGLSQEDEKPDALLDIPKRLRDHALFVAFAPADNPQIAIAVVAEHSGGGGAVAAPIARQVLDEHFSSNAQAGPVSASGVSDNNSTSLVP